MQSTQRVGPEIIDQVSLRLDQFITLPLEEEREKITQVQSFSLSH